MTEAYKPIPDTKKYQKLGKVATVGLAAGIAFSAAGCNIADLFRSEGPANALPTPSGEVGQVSPSPISSVEVSPNPSVDISPLPSSSTEPTPSPTKSVEPTSTPNPIESVPIIHYGDISTQLWGFAPYYNLQIDRAEIVAVEPPTAQNPNFEFAITVPSDSGKIESKCTKQVIGTDTGTATIPSCNFQGITIWNEITKNTVLVGGKGGRVTGSEGAMEDIDNLKVGSVISNIWIEFVKETISSTQAAENKTVFNEIIAENGKKSFPRADKIFTFNTTAVVF